MELKSQFPFDSNKVNFSNVFICLVIMIVTKDTAVLLIISSILITVLWVCLMTQPGLRASSSSRCRGAEDVFVTF